MFGIEKLERELIQTNAMLDHISGQLEAIARLLRLFVEDARGGVEFEPDEGAFDGDGEALTA